MKRFQKYSKKSDVKIRRDEQEAFEIYSENCDGNFDILYYRDKFIFTNDYTETLSIINEESSFDRQCVSRSGAIGLMQLMPRTAGWIAEKMNFSSSNYFSAFFKKYTGFSPIEYKYKNR